MTTHTPITVDVCSILHTRLSVGVANELDWIKIALFCRISLHKWIPWNISYQKASTTVRRKPAYLIVEFAVEGVVSCICI